MTDTMKNIIQRLEQDGERVIHDEQMESGSFSMRRVALADRHGMVHLVSEATDTKSGFSDFNEMICSVSKLEEIVEKAKEVR